MHVYPPLKDYKSVIHKSCALLFIFIFMLTYLFMVHSFHKAFFTIKTTNHEKLEFAEFSLISPVSTRFTNCFATSLQKFCARRKHRIKILKTVRHRHRNDLGRTVFRFPIYSTGPE